MYENNLNNYLKDVNAFRVENSLIAQGYLEMALLNAVPTSTTMDKLYLNRPWPHICL